MDKKTMLQVLLPAGAAAAVVLLIGVLIALGDKPGEKTGGGAGGSGSAPVNDEGMVDELPSVDAPEWKPSTGGMKVWDVVEGTGDPCPTGATVTIHYTGWTKDGKVFDSSKKRGQPATFPLGDLIAGWQEGIPGMKAGGIRRLYIPYQKAYGERGSPPNIPARADLVFEIKLFKF